MRVALPTVALTILCVLALSCGETTPKAEPEVNPLIETVRTYVRLANAAKVDSLLTLFSESAVMYFGPLGAVAGKADIRELHHYDRSLRTSLRLTAPTAEGDTVICQLTETNDWLLTTGIDSLQFDLCRFEFDDAGKIAKVEAHLEPDSEEELAATMSRFDTWARKNRAEAYSELFKEDGSFDFSYRNGRIVLALLSEWQKAGH